MVSANLVSKFTAEIEAQHGRYLVEIPESEVMYGTLEVGDICQISVEKSDTGSANTSTESDGSAPPVSPGDQRRVEIADVGEKGDGIARVDRGYVLIIPGASLGEEVTVEIQDVQPNYGFAEIVSETEDSENSATTS